MGIIIRKLREDELHLANDFFNKIYKSNRSFDSFRWEFMEGPSGPAIYVAAFDEDSSLGPKVVGIQCAIPLIMKTLEGEHFLTAKSEDTLVDPDYRGFDVFNKMYSLLFELCEEQNIRFIWGFTPAFKPFAKLGFDMDVKCSQMIYVLSPISSYRYLSSLNKANRLWEKVKICGLCAIGFLKSKFWLLRGRNGADITFLEGAFSNLDMLNGKNLGQHTIIALSEDQEFVRWRIHHNPYGNHYRHLIFLDKAKREFGSVVINMRNHVGFIEQISFVSDLESGLQQVMIRKAIHELQRQGAALIRFLATDGNLQNESEIHLLKSIGFLHVKRGSWFVWRGVGNHPATKSRQVIINRLYTQGIM